MGEDEAIIADYFLTSSELAACSTPAAERRLRPPPPQEEPLRCPRCDSTNTKFCYYNNYSLSQPRYFCRSCRRYWTKGGSLRNVPVGGACRRNKRYRPASAAISAATTVQPVQLPNFSTNNVCLNIMNNCMEEPCQNLKFFLDGEGSSCMNNILSIGWQESIGYSDDGSLSSSWAL